MTALDCRGRSVPEIGAALIARYNDAAPGERFAAIVDAWGPGLRMWLLEAGARHDLEPCAEGWRVTIERASSPAQGSMPGVHHVVTDGTASVWTCERGERVARIDLADQRVAACATVAQKASHLALSPDGKVLVVADPGRNAVIALDAASLALIDRWDAPGRPQLPLVSPEGVVCVTGGGTGTVTLAWPRGGRYETAIVPVGRAPHDPLLAADGAHVWVPCAGSGELVKLRLADGGIVGRVAVGDGPSHLAGDARTGRVYAANSWDGTVSAVTDGGELIATVASGRWCHAIDLTPDGRRLWAANFYDDTLAVFDTDGMERIALLPTERYAHGLDISADGRHVVATGFSSEFVRVYDAAACRELARIEVGRGSSHTAFAHDGTAAYVGCSVSAHVAVVDLRNGRCGATLSLP